MSRTNVRQTSVCRPSVPRQTEVCRTRDLNVSTQFPRTIDAATPRTVGLRADRAATNDRRKRVLRCLRRGRAIEFSPSLIGALVFFAEGRQRLAQVRKLQDAESNDSICPGGWLARDRAGQAFDLRCAGRVSTHSRAPRAGRSGRFAACARAIKEAPGRR